jgi:hypothetical protein
VQASQTTYFRLVCEIVKLRVWPRHKDCLLMTCRRIIISFFFIAPRMLRTLIISDFLPSKTKSELKEMRNDFIFFRAIILYHPRNWCFSWPWRIDYPRHFWLWLIWHSTLTLPITFSLAVYDLFRSTRCSCHLEVFKAHYLRLSEYE